MTVAIAVDPSSPHNGNDIEFTVSEDVAAGLEGPVTMTITRDSDSEIVARSVPFGIGEKFGYSDEDETLTITATGGTYKLTVDGHQTAAIAFGANAAAIEAAITLAVGADVVAVSGTGPFHLKAKGADLDISDVVTVDATSLTGGTATIALVTAGGTGNFSDSAGSFQWGTVLATGNYHMDVVDASQASQLPGGTPIALVVAS